MMEKRKSPSKKQSPKKTKTKTDAAERGRRLKLQKYSFMHSILLKMLLHYCVVVL